MCLGRRGDGYGDGGDEAPLGLVRSIGKGLTGPSSVRTPADILGIGILRAIVFVLLIWMQTGPAKAYTADQLRDEFDARQLTDQEKRLLQVGLAFANVYNGLIDGAWGKGSQRALERFTLANGGSVIVTNADAVLAALEAFSAIREEGWERQYNASLDMSFLVPTAALTDGEPSEAFVNLEVAGRSIGYSMTISEGSTAERYHDYTANRATGEVYTVRRPILWITSARTADGVSLYTRSDFRKGRWSTLMISGTDRDAGAFAAITGSIAPGYAPAIGISPGRLATGVYVLARILADGTTEGPPAAEPGSDGVTANAAPVAPASGSGTGFIVTTSGHLLTNQHVIAGCSSLTVDENPARVLAEDAVFDLALLQVDALAGREPASFSGTPARLNSDVTVVGYPLSGLLGGLNVTRGTVTSTKGIGGDGINMQISAPVQPGNSGGPVLSASGLVVGVVVARLSDQYAMESFGTVPQNVNFAIRGEIAKLFLAQNGVEPVILADGQDVAPEDLADLAAGFTRLISCR